MSTNCIIEFSNPSGVFYAGQELSGTVRIVNNIEKIIRAISIAIVGKATVDWTESGSEDGDKFEAEENFLSSCIYLVGSAHGAALTYKPGIYDYQFNDLLPSALPTTFNDYEGGRIFYYVCVTINQVGHSNEIFEERFQIIHVLDLNIDPKYREPQIINKSKQFRCWSCTSGSVDITLLLPATGFVPGQLINFNVNVDNTSNADVDNITAYILQEVRFKSTSPNEKVKHTTKKIESTEIGWVWKSTRKEFILPLMVPETPPSTIDTCECIQIEYYFFVVAEAGCCSTKLELFTKIFIGTVPIDNNPTATDIPITTQPTMTQNTPLLPTILEKNIARSYNTFTSTSFH